MGACDPMRNRARPVSTLSRRFSAVNWKSVDSYSDHPMRQQLRLARAGSALVQRPARRGCSGARKRLIRIPAGSQASAEISHVCLTLNSVLIGVTSRSIVMLNSLCVGLG